MTFDLGQEQERVESLLAALSDVWSSHVCLLEWRMHGWRDVVAECWERAEQDVATAFGRPSPAIDALIESEGYVLRSSRSVAPLHKLHAILTEGVFDRLIYDRDTSHRDRKGDAAVHALCDVSTALMLRSLKPSPMQMLRRAVLDLGNAFEDLESRPRLRNRVGRLWQKVALLNPKDDSEAAAERRFIVLDSYSPVIHALKDALWEEE